MLRNTDRRAAGGLYQSPYQSRHDALAHSQTGYNFHLPENLYTNDHIESINPNAHSAWVPPNDRELIIRAKLKTGWSSRNSPITNNTSVSKIIPTHSANNSTSASDNSSNSSNNSSLISDLECLEIEQVLARAARIEQKEMNRVSNLYERWTCMNKPMGNGRTNCLICNSVFGTFECTPKICADCMMNVCSTCSIDTYPPEQPHSKTIIHLCKICSEYREFLKKSGAWFNKRLPSADPLLNNRGPQCLSNCSPLKRATEIQLSSKVFHGPDSFKITDESSSDIDEPTLNTLRNSTSNQTGFKKLQDYSDDDYNEPSTINACPSIETIDKQFETLEHTVPNVQIDIKNSIIHIEEPDSTIIKQPVVQSNSSIKISENLKAEFERETFHLPRRPIRQKVPLETTSLKKKSLTDLTNLSSPPFNIRSLEATTMTQKRRSSYKKGEMPDSMGSEPNLNLIKDQIAASRNLPSNSSKALGGRLSVTKASGNGIRSGTSMVNLATHNVNQSNNSLGSIQFTVEYIRSLLQLKIYLISATSLASKDSNGLSDPYIKLHLLPGIAKATKLRSKTVYKNLNPQFNEYLQYDGITLEDLDSKVLRLTVNDEDKFGYDFIGEYRLSLNMLLLDEVNKFDVVLEAKKELGDEEDLSFRGKINFALKYCKTACCLYVKINRCRQLLPMDNGKTSDPFVEICLLPVSSQKENKHRFKTTVKKRTLDPEYSEEFKFQNLDLKTLLSKTIEITVWDKDFGKNDYIGSVSLNQMQTGAELKHFFTMVKNTDIYHEQWHSLKDKEDFARTYV